MSCDFSSSVIWTTLGHPHPEEGLLRVQDIRDARTGRHPASGQTGARMVMRRTIAPAAVMSNGSKSIPPIWTYDRPDCLAELVGIQSRTGAGLEVARYHAAFTPANSAA